MTKHCYRFTLKPAVGLDEAEFTLHLAIFSVEGLFGGARLRTEARYQRLIDEHAILVDADTEVGVSLVQVFTNLLTREFGEDSFSVTRVEAEPAADAAGGRL